MSKRLTLREVSERTGLAIESVRASYMSLKPGHLRGELVDGLVVIEEEELARWLRERTAEPGWKRQKRHSWNARVSAQGDEAAS